MTLSRFAAFATFVLGTLATSLARADFAICRYDASAEELRPTAARKAPTIADALQFCLRHKKGSPRDATSVAVASAIPPIADPAVAAEGRTCAKAGGELLLFYHKEGGRHRRWAQCVYQASTIASNPAKLLVLVERISRGEGRATVHGRRVTTCLDANLDEACTSDESPSPFEIWDGETGEDGGSPPPPESDLILALFLDIIPAASAGGSEALSIVRPGDPTSFRVRQSTVSHDDSGPFGVALSLRPFRLARDLSADNEVRESGPLAWEPWYEQPVDSKTKIVGDWAHAVADSLEFSAAALMDQYGSGAGAPTAERYMQGVAADLFNFGWDGVSSWAHDGGARGSFVRCMKEAAEGPEPLSVKDTRRCRSAARSVFLVGTGVALVEDDLERPLGFEVNGARAWLALEARPVEPLSITASAGYTSVDIDHALRGDERGDDPYFAGLRVDLFPCDFFGLAGEGTIDRARVRLSASASIPLFGGFVAAPGFRTVLGADPSLHRMPA